LSIKKRNLSRISKRVLFKNTSTDNFLEKGKFEKNKNPILRQLYQFKLGFQVFSKYIRVLPTEKLQMYRKSFEIAF
jgi:hypothetical protein